MNCVAACFSGPDRKYMSASIDMIYSTCACKQMMSEVFTCSRGQRKVDEGHHITTLV